MCRKKLLMEFLCCNRLTPKIGFPWSEIRNISFNDRKFVIKPIDKKAPDFVFFAPRLRINKRILALCMGNHELYMRRRKPDTIEVQQMKAQAQEERRSKMKEREKLQREIQAREMAERKQQEYADRLKSMQEEMERRQRELLEAQETIRRLEEQLRQLQKAKEELEVSQKELHNMMKRLEEAKEMEMAEKIKLEEEIRAKQVEVQRIAEEVQRKDDETRRLQEEVEDARRRQEEAAAALIAATTTPQHQHVNEGDHVINLICRLVLGSWRVSPLIRLPIYLFRSLFLILLSFSIQDEGEDEDDDTPNGDISAGKDLISESDINSIRDPVEDRLTLAEKNERLQNQLKVRFLFLFSKRIFLFFKFTYLFDLFGRC